MRDGLLCRLSRSHGERCFSLWAFVAEKPTANQKAVDRGYHCPASKLAEEQSGSWPYRIPQGFARATKPVRGYIAAAHL